MRVRICRAPIDKVALRAATRRVGARMLRVVRPLAVFSIASAVSAAAALQMVVGVGGAHGADGKRGGVEFGYEHELARLRLLEKTLYHIEESYVEPQRIDWENMYVEALEAVERKVPATMFSREPGGSIVSVEIGDFRTVLEVDPIQDRRELARELREVASLLQQQLERDDIPTDEPSVDPYASVEYAMINGLLSTLDPHSVLLPPPDASQMDVENQGEFGGLGIVIVERDNRLTIEYPLPRTPAMEAGLQSDDRIVRIDGESTINMSLDEAVRLLRGPIGKPVDLQIERAGAPDVLTFRIERQRIKVNEVRGELLEGDVGYVRIESFHQQVEADLLDQLARLHRQTVSGELRGLILDLRGNPGGYLTQAVRVADAFLDEGTIVSTVDGRGQRRDEEIARKRGNESEPLYPIAVLVDASSASASEIVAGALRNNERAVIIGERTFGKGSVQNLHTLVDDSKLKITISKYLTPGDHSIQSIGIPADIELRPAIVTPGSGDPSVRDLPLEPVVQLFHRERVRREADLDKHLDQAPLLHTERPAYEVPYLRAWDQRRSRRSLENVGDDAEVQFARNVLLAARSWRRAEILAGVGPVVQRARARNEAAIQRAFGQLGLDWSSGPAWPRDQVAQSAPSTREDGAAAAYRGFPVELRLDLGEDDVIVAGETEVIGLEVTNTSDQTLYQVAVVARDNEIIEGREFYFGKLDPGETGRWEHTVTLTDGFPSERSPVTLQVRDAGEGPLLEHEVRLPVAGRPLPRFEWSWTLHEVGGDQNGMAEVGERLDIELTVRNVGNGPSSSAFARIKNRSGRSLDILRGNLAPGIWTDGEGVPCTPEEPGVAFGVVYGDPDHTRVQEGQEPVWPDGCEPVLAPGAEWTGRFAVDLKEAPPDGQYVVELSLGDVEAFDYATVVRGRFDTFFTQREELTIPVGAPLPAVPTRSPPVVQVTRAPALEVDSGRVTLSGLVEDDRGIAHVMVFAGDDKVFYQGGGPGSPVRSVPFTADVQLQRGSNTITVLATDVDGFTHSRSVVTWYGDPELARSTPTR